MAKRKGGGRSARRRSFWVHFARDTAGINIGANVAQNETLFSLPEDTNLSLTVVRIVGSVYLGIQATPAFVVPVFWGIYKRPTSSADSLVLNAIDPTDRGSEEWLHHRIVNEFQADLVHHWKDDMVDVKVMRIITENEELASAANCTAAYHICENLRGLFLE